MDVAPDGTLVESYHQAVLTRLGEGLGASGTLKPAAGERTLDVVRAYTENVRKAGAEAVAITTSVLRRADDGEAFRERFREITGVELRILTGEEEARCSFLGATYGTNPIERVAVLDIGGGSTECAVGVSAVEDAVSVEIGAVRLTEMFPALAGHGTVDEARAAAVEADRYVSARFAASYGRLKASRMMAVAGTPRTIGAIRFAGGSAAIEGRALSIEDAGIVRDRLLSLSYEARRRVEGMTPERADILVAGAIILVSVLKALTFREASITRNDLLLGFLSIKS